MVDLGLAAKVRPCMVVSIPFQDNERSLVTVLAHTTSPRNTRFEVEIEVKFLSPGVFDVQNLVTVPRAKLVRKLGELSPSHLVAIENAVRLWLGL